MAFIRMLLLHLIFSPMVLFAQKNLNLGQGVLIIDYHQTPALYFYSDTFQKTPSKIVTVTKKSDGEYDIRNKFEIEKWFQPEALDLDYSIFVIRVDTTIGKWHKVFVHNERGVSLWTKAEKIKHFKSWERFLLEETTAIEKHPHFQLPVKQAPSEQSGTIKQMEIEDCFEAVEIKGDWMRIKTNENLDCNQSKKPVKSGWIRWKRNNRLLIEYGLTC